MQQTNARTGVFISYKRSDSAFVDRLEVDLRVRDFDTWLDRRDLASRGGANWRRELQLAIDRAHALVLVVTPDANQSPYVGWEYRYALLLGRPVYALLLKDCPDGVPQEILNPAVRWLDFRSAESYPRALDNLVNLLFDLPQGAVPPRPDGVKFADDAPVQLVPLGTVEVARPGEARVQVNLDELYRAAVQAEANDKNIDRAVNLYQRILSIDPQYRGGFVANRMDALLKQREALWTEQLGKIAYQARLEGAWGLEVVAQESLLSISKGDVRAKAGLELARLNQSFAWLYNQALEYYNSGDETAARHQLSELYKNAPDYGDPAGLARSLGISVKPPREATGTVRQDIVRAAQEQWARVKTTPAPQQTAPAQPEPKRGSAFVPSSTPAQVQDPFAAPAARPTTPAPLKHPWWYNSAYDSWSDTTTYATFIGSLAIAGLFGAGIGMIFTAPIGWYWAKRVIEYKQQHGLGKR